MSNFNKKLRGLLLKDGRIPVDEVDASAKDAAQEKTSLARVLVEKGVISEKEIIGLIAREIGFPPIDLTRVRPDKESVALVSREVAEKHLIVPISKIGNFLTVAVADPFDVLKLDNVRLMSRCEIRPVVTSEHQVVEALRGIYNAGEEKVAEFMDKIEDDGFEVRENQQDEVDIDVDPDAAASPVVKLVNLIIYQAIREGVSDIHIEPFYDKVVVRYRRDGLLRESVNPPKKMQNAIVSRIKILSGMDIAERRKPQDGKFQVRAEGRQIDFRVSILPVVNGEKVVLRVLDAGNLTLRLETLGFEPTALKDFSNAIASPYGLILVTGPTGSGKSTTLYSAVREMANPTNNFVTVEDPVEYQLDGINQVPVNNKRELTFAAALRSILRQDPDVILVGEIRDAETLEIAVKAALTGHLVLSTLHTNDAPSAVTRMVDMGLDPFMVASSLLLVAAQRLIRTLCDSCKEEHDEIPPERLLNAGFTEVELNDMTLFKPVGCSQCHEVGYRGRFAILETLPISDGVARVIMSGKSAIEIKDKALEEGMMTLRRCGLLNAIRGRTSLEEVLRVTLADG